MPSTEPFTDEPLDNNKLENRNEIKKSVDSKESNKNLNNESQKAKQLRKIHTKKVLAEQEANRAREKKFRIKATEFLCQPKFINKLPDIPFEPKFLEYPGPADRFVRYHPTNLEKKYRLKLNPEPDLGLAIDLVDMENFKLPRETPGLPEEDALLFEEEKLQSKGKKIRPNVTWLRRTEYLANDLFDAVHCFQSGKRQEMISDVERSLSLIKNEETVEDSFSAIALDNLDATHPSDESLRAVEILPIFPDAVLFANRYQLAYFDLDPVNDLGNDDEAKERMNKSIIRNVDYANTNSVVKTLCGSVIVPQKGQTEGETLDFLRDYQFDTKELRQGQFLFLQKPDSKEITLCNIERRIEMKKKKEKPNPERMRGAIVTRTEYSQEEATIRRKVLQSVGGKLLGYEDEKELPDPKRLKLSNVENKNELEEKEKIEKSDEQMSEENTKENKNKHEKSEEEKSDEEKSDEEKSDEEKSDEEKSDEEKSDEDKSEDDDDFPPGASGSDDGTDNSSSSSDTDD